MLFAASVRVTFKKAQRRLDIIVEAENLESAKEKVLKQARKIYAPGKKAIYTIIGTISETEIYTNFPQTNETPSPE
ncbi:MAG TPA: hypothetical protein DDW50_10170 [Firmicutes bacterium]|jgi:hypothetical protein|nr:hypothetical protein [Bacillota bacterium]